MRPKIHNDLETIARFTTGPRPLSRTETNCRGPAPNVEQFRAFCPPAVVREPGLLVAT